MRQLRIRMPDESVRAIPVDEHQPVANLMVIVCTKLGITNHDEYSLISTSQHNTINGRRKEPPKVEGRIVDPKMEQLKKKLKTDEDLAWLDHSKTLDEQGVHADDIVLLRRKFFYSDHNVDSRDPMQLGLLYVQTRDAIISGSHPMTVDSACKFAGLQAQAQLGNFVEGKTTRPGYLNLKAFLPSEYAKIRNVERKVFAEHRKHYGLSELDAKARYLSEARSLSTYGVTFFLVKEILPNKNKLVPRLIGVTRDCVMRVDADSKAVLKTWPLTTIKRHLASVNTFTLDFGDYADSHYLVQTSEGEQISQLIAGYIDIIVKRRKAKDHFGIDGDEGATMVEDSVAPSRATVLTNVPTLQRPPKQPPQLQQPQPKPELEREQLTASSIGPEVTHVKVERGPVIEPGEFRPAVEIRGKAEIGFESKPITQYVTNYELTIPQRDLQTRLEHAQEAVEEAQKELDKAPSKFEQANNAQLNKQRTNNNSSSKQTFDEELAARKLKLESDFASINAATAQLVSLSAIPEDELDYKELNAAAEAVRESLPSVARDVKVVASMLDDERSSEQLIDAARRLCKAFSDLLNAAEPGPTVPRQSLISAASRVGDATQALLYAIDGFGEPRLTASNADLSAESSDMLLALAKSVANAAAALVLRAKDVAATCQTGSANDDELNSSVIGGATQCALTTSQMVATAKIVAPTINDAQCQRKLLESCREVKRAVDGIESACNREVHDKTLLASVGENVERVNCALDELIAHVANIARRTRQQQQISTTTITTTKTTTTKTHNYNQQQQQQQQQLQNQRPASIYDSRSNDELNNVSDDNGSRETNRELVKQARTLAQATTQLIQDIRPTNQVTQQQQQQQQYQHERQQLTPPPPSNQNYNRHSVYESEDYELYRKQQQQSLANEAAATHNQRRQQQRDNAALDATSNKYNSNNKLNTTSTTTTTTTVTSKQLQANNNNNINNNNYNNQSQMHDDYTINNGSQQQQIKVTSQQHYNDQFQRSSSNNSLARNNNNDNDNDDDNDDDNVIPVNVELDDDNAENAISGIIGDLETTIVFASAGSLRAEQDDTAATYGYQRENILRTAKALVEDTKQLVTSAAGDEQQLKSAARDSVITVSRLAEAVKAGAASLGPSNVDAQVSLIRSVKDVASSLSGLIGSTKAAHKQDASDSSMAQVKDSAKSMVTSVTSLLRTVKSVEDEQERGVRAIELAIEAIENDLNVHDSACANAEQQTSAERQEARARPEELVRVSKPMTLAAAKTVSAASSGHQDDAIVAANMGRKALSDLLLVSRCASFGADDEELRARVQDAGRQCALGYRQLLQLLHQTLQRPASATSNPELKQQLVGQSRHLAACVTEVVTCSELLRTAQATSKLLTLNTNNNNNININDSINSGQRPLGSSAAMAAHLEELSATAETELLGAASSIDAAARKLQNLKPRVTSVKLPHEELNFDEIILEAAKSIIEATAALLRAASASQRELLVDGRLDETETFYAPDHNQWSEGLVSGARMVAAATHSLVEAANSLVQGAASEERLISAAKQVASSTNQLIVACKVKADPDSKTISRLQNAGSAVKRATDNLVRASQQAIEHDEEQSLVISNRKVSGIAQEISAREQILRKEKELQVAKTQLMAIRKAKYSNRPDDYQGYGGSLD